MVIILLRIGIHKYQFMMMFLDGMSFSMLEQLNSMMTGPPLLG